MVRLTVAVFIPSSNKIITFPEPFGIQNDPVELRSPDTPSTFPSPMKILNTPPVCCRYGFYIPEMFAPRVI